MKKFMILIISTYLTSLIGNAIAEENACPLTYWDDYAIEVPVTFKFANPLYQSKWVYDSLNPKLITSGRWGISPKKVKIENNELHLSFCVDHDIDNSALWKLKIGNHIIKIKPRPTSMVSKKITSYSGKEKIIQIGRMPKIMLYKQKDPNWIIFKNANWLTTKSGEHRLEIELFNPMDQEFTGSEVTLVFNGQKTIFCVKPSREHPEPIPVEISINEQSISVSTGDPIYQELINRKAYYHPEDCSQNPHVIMGLGQLGSIPPKSSLTQVHGQLNYA